MQLKRIKESDLKEVYREDTIGRRHSNSSTKNFIPYINKKVKQIVPIYPVITYNLYR